MTQPIEEKCKHDKGYYLSEKGRAARCCLCGLPYEEATAKDGWYHCQYCIGRHKAGESCQSAIEEKWKEEFDKKFLYWVVLGSTLNDGSELRWNVGDGKLPDIEKIKSFIENLLEQERVRMSEEVKNLLLPLANVNEVEKVDDAIKYMGRLRRSDIIAETIGKIRAYQSALSIINK